MTDHYQIESVKFISSQWERIKEQVSQQQMRTSTVTTTAKHGPIYYCDKRTFSTVSEHTVVIRDPWTVRRVTSVNHVRYTYLKPVSSGSRALYRLSVRMTVSVVRWLVHGALIMVNHLRGSLDGILQSHDD